MLYDDFADLQPCQPQSDEEQINTLLDLLAGGFEGDEDLDLVRDAALQHLLRFPRLPDRTTAIMLGIVADKDNSDLVLDRKVAAIDVLAHMGAPAKPALAILNDLLPLVESDRDSKRWLALRAAKAMWKIMGDSAHAEEIARKLIEDDQFWLTIHAAELFREIGSAE